MKKLLLTIVMLLVFTACNKTEKIEVVKADSLAVDSMVVDTLKVDSLKTDSLKLVK